MAYGVKKSYTREEYLHNMVAAIHGIQKDKNGLPYIYHLEAVAANAVKIAEDLGLSSEEVEECYAAALAHDTVEDTYATKGDGGWLEYFGWTSPETDIVEVVSKGKGENNAEYVGRIIEGRTFTNRVIDAGPQKPMIVKLADLYNNTEEARLLELAPSTSNSTAYKPTETKVVYADGTEKTFLGYQVELLLKKYVPAIDRLEEALGLPRTFDEAFALEAREKQATTHFVSSSTEWKQLPVLNLIKYDELQGLGTIVHIEKNSGKGADAPIEIVYKTEAGEEKELTCTRTAVLPARYGKTTGTTTYTNTTSNTNVNLGTSQWVYGPRKVEWVNRDDLILETMAGSDTKVEFKVTVVIKKGTDYELHLKKLSALSSSDPVYIRTYASGEQVTAKMSGTGTGSYKGSTATAEPKKTISLTKPKPELTSGLKYVLWPVSMLKPGDLVQGKGRVVAINESSYDPKTRVIIDFTGAGTVCATFSKLEQVPAVLKETERKLAV